VIVVFDSGVWISAMQFDGTPWLAIQKGLGFDQIAICAQIKDEITRTLVQKMGWSIHRVVESLGLHLHDAIWASVPGNLYGVCRDHNDDMVLECAINANAKLIVAGDKDLLILREYQGIRIVSPREYVIS